MIFTDTVTIYHKNGTIWDRTVIEGVQWSDHFEKSVNTGRLTIERYATITFPEGAYEWLELDLNEDGIVYGEVTDTAIDVKGSRLSDILSKYPKSGIVRVINDNSNRDFLKHIKVVVG